MIPDEKRCGGCGEVKPADAFYVRRKGGRTMYFNTAAVSE